MTSPAGLTVSVVVPTYKRRALLARAISPLLTSGAHEVLVVVDGVDDGSMELLQGLAETSPALRPLWRENGGEGAARQTGLDNATGDVVLFLDDDVLAGPGLVEGHAQVHAEGEGRVVLGYMPTSVPVERAPGQFATFLYSQEYEESCRRYELGATDVLTYLWAGNMSLRRADALRVGMVGDDFRGVYHADQDFGLRCAAAGLQGIFVRDLASEHVHDRPLLAFVRDARAQGAGRVRLAVAHPDVLPLPSDDEFLTGLPRPVQALAVSSRALGVLCSALGVVVRLTGRARLYPVESLSAKMLRRLEQVRGARTERSALLGADAGVRAD